MESIEHARRDDLAALRDLYNQSLATSHANFDTRPTTLEQRATWLDGFAATGPHQLLVARDNDRHVLGYASTSRYRDHEAFRHTVEVSVSLREDCRGQGIGTALYEALFERIATEPVHVALAGIALPNEASIALHRKLGFTTVGTFQEYAVKNGRYISSIWMQRLCERENWAPATR